MTCRSSSSTFPLCRLWLVTLTSRLNVCVPIDSPFSDGKGNDYLFVGNMVYTVSILLSYLLLFIYVSILFLLCHLACTVVHFCCTCRVFVYTSVPCCFLRAVMRLQSIWSRLASLSPLHIHPSFLSVHFSISHSGYHFTPHRLMWMSVMFNCVLWGSWVFFTDIAEFTI